MLNDDLRDVANGDAHVFLVLHDVVEVEIVDVTSHKLGAGGGKHAVDEDFDCGESGSLGADIIGVLGFGETDLFLDGFVRLVG